MPNSIHSKEMKLYFETHADLQTSLRECNDAETNLLLDEIEGMQIHTTQPCLRRKCTTVLADHRPLTGVSVANLNRCDNL